MSGSNIVFNRSLGSVAEMVRDDATKLLLILLKVVQADATLRDHDDVGAILAAANTEADFTNYARKTAITGTVTVNDTTERVDVDIPDQTFVAAGGATNNTLVKAVIAYENAAADATRVPQTAHTFDVTTDGSDLVVQIASAGYFGAS